MRLLYLTRGPIALSGHDAFAGRELFDQLASDADEALAAHVVAPPGREADVALELLDRDVLTSRSYFGFDPHVIYFEGGMMGTLDDWRVPRVLLEQSVRAGAIAVIADAEFNELNGQREAYLAAAKVLGVTPNYGLGDADVHRLGPSPVYGMDRNTHEREFDVSPEKMMLSSWLRPIYAGIERIVAVSPVELVGAQDILASGDVSSTATLQRDVFVEEMGYCTFASVHQLGDGYIVLIAAAVSHDSIVERAPDNARWIRNIIRFLRAEIAKDARRYAGIRRLQRAFENSTRRSADPDDRELRMNQALDEEAHRTLRREVAKAAREQLSEVFGPLWSSVSDEAARQLVAAEIYRRDTEALADTEHWLDFSAAVGAYSRAVEIELLRRLFEPYRGRPDADQLPDPRSEKRERRSLTALRRHLDGHDPSLGEMAFILMNVGCRLRDEEPNAFSRYLRSVLKDHSSFCDDVRFPQRLHDYAQRYRNRAMHVDELSAAECKAARDFLFEEPVRLLLYLSEALSV